MKINTDGVLLGALVQSANPASILDIGTGTGVIAMMLAQRFPKAKIEAIEIDSQAAKTAAKNFNNAPYSARLTIFNQSFQDFSTQYPEKKYDLIVSNPPFFTNSFINPDKQKQLARHTTNLFFTELIKFVQQHLTLTGACYFILPLDAGKYFTEEGLKHHLNLQQVIDITSSELKTPHRQLIKLGFNKAETTNERFIIYEAEKVYTEQYRAMLKDFLTIF